MDLNLDQIFNGKRKIFSPNRTYLPNSDFPSRREKEHHQNLQEKLFECAQCQTYFTTKFILATHLANTHGTFLCRKIISCNKTFENSIARESHEQTVPHFKVTTICVTFLY